MIEFKEIYDAYKKCKKNKANTYNTLDFEINLIDNLWELYYLINNYKYTPSSYIYFLTHSPKLREVFASNFKDRVVHHLLISYLEPLFEPVFIYDSYSCRKNKGTHKAVKRIQFFSRKYNSKYFLQLDIKNFFLTIDKNILYKLILDRFNKQYIKNKEVVLYLTQKIIFDDPTKKCKFKCKPHIYKTLPPHKTLFNCDKDIGLPIGNLTSQFFANVYLNILDHFIKRGLKTKSYVRYVDDFILLGSSKEELIDKKKKIELFLEDELKLKLKDSYFLKPLNQGMDFLGYIIRPKYLLVRNRVVNNFKFKKTQFLNNVFVDGTCSMKDAKKFKQINASYYGHFKLANSYNLIKKYQIDKWIEVKL